MNRDEFTKHGKKMVDWLAGYFENLDERRVHPDIAPGDIKARLPGEAPEKGESLDTIFDDFENILMGGITHWQHPSWFAYFPANNSPPSILAELLTAGLGTQCMIWKTSPAAEELEEVVLDWLGHAIGIPKGMKGVIQGSASEATLTALITARERASHFEINEYGFNRPLAVYCSEEAHSSVMKGAKIAGYGSRNVRLIPTDEYFAMIPKALRESMEADAANGIDPAFVCATLGTTSSTGVDSIGEIGPICKRFNAWLHVDGAFAGTAAILPERKWMMDGMETVDSFVFNPHKWMLTNFDCSAYYVKDTELLRRTFHIHPEYLKTDQDAEVNNYRDWGIPLGRRFRALKLWYVLRYYGVEGIREMVREHLRLAEQLKGWIADHRDFELMAPVPFSLVCFRLNPGGRTEDELSDLNKRLIESINQTGRTLLTQTTLKGKYTIRVSIGQRTTASRHVAALWDLIQMKSLEIL